MLKRNYFVVLIFFSLFLVNITDYASINVHKTNPIVCDNAYALCSASACQKIPGLSNKVLCKCSIWKGKNIGYSSCQKRKEKKDTSGDTLLLSTFSLGGSHYRFMTCPSSKIWANCLDQPCLVDKYSTNQRKAFCACKIMKNTSYVTFAGNCDTRYCAKAIWSGATESGNKKLINFLIKNTKQRSSLEQAACVFENRK